MNQTLVFYTEHSYYSAFWLMDIMRCVHEKLVVDFSFFLLFVHFVCRLCAPVVPIVVKWKNLSHTHKSNHNRTNDDLLLVCTSLQLTMRLEAFWCPVCKRARVYMCVIMMRRKAFSKDNVLNVARLPFECVSVTVGVSVCERKSVLLNESLH